MASGVNEAVAVELEAGKPLGITLPQSLSAPARAEAVTGGSTAEAAGVCVGDCVVSVGPTCRQGGKPLSTRECIDAVKASARPLRVVFNRQPPAESPSSSVHNGTQWLPSRLPSRRDDSNSAVTTDGSAPTANGNDSALRFATLRTELEEVSEQLRELADDPDCAADNAQHIAESLHAKLKWAVNEATEAEKDTSRLIRDSERCTAAEAENERLAKEVQHTQELQERVGSLEDAYSSAERALEEARSESIRVASERDEAQSEQASANCRAQMAEQETQRVCEDLEQLRNRVSELEDESSTARSHAENARAEAQRWEEEAKTQRERADNNARIDEQIESLQHDLQRKDEQLRDAMEETEKLAKRAANAEKQAVSAKGRQRDRRNLAEENERLQAEADAAKQQLQVMEELLRTERQMRSQQQQQQHQHTTGGKNQSNSVHNDMLAFSRLAQRHSSSPSVQNTQSAQIVQQQMQQQQQQQSSSQKRK